jgi:3-oxoacyl-[acyl-carrier protein] reductase
MGEFENKVYVVTGGARGIGRAISLKLGGERARVIITYHRDAEAAKSTVAGIESAGGRGYAYQVDSGDFAGVKEFAKTIKTAVGPVDGLVNNAGVTRDKSLYMMSEEEWDVVLRTNLDGTFNVTRHLLVDFLKRKSGAIVNVTSVAAFTGLMGQANYSASKAGIIGFTLSLAREAARAGVRANAVAPGFIETDMVKAMRPEALASQVEQIPLQTIGAPDDVADAVLFLLSNRSRYITGHTLVVDGGLTI